MIRLLLVDDSATVRHRLRTLFERESDFEVVAEARDGDEAVVLAERHQPDAVVLDVFLPRQNAAEVVRHLLDAAPVPIVLVSDAPKETAEVFAALDAGALDFLAKPPLADEAGARWLVETVRALNRVKVRRRPVRPRRPLEQPPAGAPRIDGRARLIAIGSSAGGPAALRELLSELPASFPVPIVVAQHLSAGFEQGLVTWLQAACGLPVSLAKDGEALSRGVRVGSPNTDVEIGRGGRTVVKVAPAGGYHPSVDGLFHTGAALFGEATIAVVLSGIGSDGVEGARTVRGAGGSVLAQDAASTVVYGMPAAVTRAGLTSRVGGPRELAREILELSGWGPGSKGKERV